MDVPRLYGDLVPFYPLIDPVEDHREEMDDAHDVLRGRVRGALTTLLELGSGAGNNAFHMKRHVACTLTDISEPMLALSRSQNPECEHIIGDMRTLRLGRTFDAVLVHDAIMYMRTLDELRAAALTAWTHTRPGGAALFLLDCTQETFVTDESAIVEGDDGTRAVRGVIWSWRPDPNDTVASEEFLLLLREGSAVRAIHETHVFGVFSKAIWQATLEAVGFVVEPCTRMSEGEPFPGFICTRSE
jgi:SAM-dependent methyltransferase